MKLVEEDGYGSIFQRFNIPKVDILKIMSSMYDPTNHHITLPHPPITRTVDEVNVME